MQLSDQQRDAIARALDWHAAGGAEPFVIAGVAGSGKTTLIGQIVKQIRGTVEIVTPTGKAALVLRQKGIAGARTLHSMMYKVVSDGNDASLTEQINELTERMAALRMRIDQDVPRDPVSTGVDFARINRQMGHPLAAEVRALDEQIRRHQAEVRKSGPQFAINDCSDANLCAAIILDEASMADDRVARDLKSFGRPVLAFGDPFQLPPVRSSGAGFDLGHPDVMLNEVHRQAAHSGILRLATSLRRGGSIDERDAADDVTIRRKSDKAAVRAGMLAAEQVIVGRNKTRHDVNRRIRELRGITDSLPVAGDRLVCLRNDHEIGVLNGGMWSCLSRAEGLTPSTILLCLQSLDEPERAPIDVEAWGWHFDGRGEEPRGWAAREAQEFAYGYAITCHKAQGSQWDDVFVYDESAQFGHDARRHAYTAITRAARKLTVAI